MAAACASVCGEHMWILREAGRDQEEEALPLESGRGRSMGGCCHWKEAEAGAWGAVAS